MTATLPYQILGLFHWGGAALTVLGYVVSLRGGVIHPVMVWGARLQFLLGLALVAVTQSLVVLAPWWIAVKFVVAVAVVALCEIARTRAVTGRNTPVLMHVAFALTLVNVLLALFWS